MWAPAYLQFCLVGFVQGKCCEDIVRLSPRESSSTIVGVEISNCPIATVAEPRPKAEPLIRESHDPPACLASSADAGVKVLVA
ncbi:hypothetical protein F4808DRAFT_442740 [Astrocystis sublimbata]|nr:hypothetical protein F4808DRAFT_442740 [Astrocystis sublimbata]